MRWPDREEATQPGRRALAALLDFPIRPAEATDDGDGDEGEGGGIMDQAKGMLGGLFK